MARRHAFDEEQRQRGTFPSPRYYGCHPASFPPLPPSLAPANHHAMRAPPHGALLPPPHHYGAPLPAASHVYPPLHHALQHPYHHQMQMQMPALMAPQPFVYHGDAHQGNPSAPQPPHVVDVDRAQMTYHGHVKTSTDAILLLAACDLPSDASAMASGAGSMNASASPPPRRIHRRLLESERPELIRTGSIFVWDEKEAGMRRWTDCRCWSASRVSGCFLTYRELEVRKRSAHDVNGPRANQYKIDGLIKQSFSMTTTSGRKLHIVSYYTKRDLREGRLRRVSEDPRFVGEAGGEWGLQVDENEFPDPVVTGKDQAAAVAAEVTKQQQQQGQRRPSATATSQSGDYNDGENSQHWMSPRTSMHSVHPLSNSMPPTPTGVPSGYQQRLAHYPDVSGSATFGKRPAAAMISAPQSTRLPLKRLRSSSAGDLVMPTPPSAAVAAPSPSDHPLRRKSDHFLWLNMSESNMRGVGAAGPSRDVRPLPYPFQHHARTASSSRAIDTPSSEQDSAAGALLSLRSFSLAGANLSNKTPLTSPEEGATPGSGVENGKDAVVPSSVAASKAMVPSSSSSSSATPARSAAPGRLNSDRDSLSKLSVRF